MVDTKTQRWWEHYTTPTGLFKRRTVEGYWDEKKKKMIPIRVIKTETVHE